jgi:hypothetical protein
MELEWAKFETFQVEEGPSSLSMNAMVEATKVLQTLVVSERKTNIQLSYFNSKDNCQSGLGQIEKLQKP